MLRRSLIAGALLATILAYHALAQPAGVQCYGPAAPRITNWVRNSTMVSAVVGTPGTAPTDWTIGPSAGVSSSVIGTGIEAGLSYIDVRLFGTPSTGNGCNINLEGTTTVPALTGQTWTGSAYLRVVGGSTANTSFSFGMIEENAGGSFVGGAFLALTNPTAGALATQRQSVTRTLSGGATVANLQPIVSVGVSNGAAIDITLRIGAPQLERAAVANAWVQTSGSAASTAELPVGYGPRQ